MQLTTVFKKIILFGFLSSLAACHSSDPTEESENNEHYANHVDQPGNASQASYRKDYMTRTGKIAPEDIIQQYKPFKQNYLKFKPSETDIKNFKKLDGYDLVVFFGLWCHDSQREVPRLIKLIEQSEVNFNSIAFYAVNSNKEMPADYSNPSTNELALTSTPTFYVLSQQQVIAKFVERPKTTITQELLSQILH
jgi:thioredoxin 1